MGRPRKSSESLVPTRITKQQFGERLQHLMDEREWNQSDLARKAGIGRDSVSTYVRGQTLPEPVALGKIAGAFGVSPKDLLPNTAPAAIGEAAPSLEIRQVHSDPSKVWLRVDQAVSPLLAAKIMELLHHENMGAATAG